MEDRSVGVPYNGRDYPSMAAIYQMIDGRVQVEDNRPWPLWASDAVYAQSVLEARNEG